MKRKIRYLCFTDRNVVAVSSSSKLDPENEKQMEWLERECRGAVYLVVEMKKHG